MATGIPVALLVGGFCDVILALLLRTWRFQKSSWKSTLTATGQVAALPFFVFGGKWATATFIAQANGPDFATPYMITLAVCVFPVILFGLYLILLTPAGSGAVAS